jgi:Fe-S-cluster containining protein
MHFECLKCCDCCKNLLHNKHGWVTALSLLPEEAYLFPPEHVFPQSGIGGYGSVKRIMTYQLDLDICPNLQGQECVIYDKRPLTCQVYPFLLEKMQPFA